MAYIIGVPVAYMLLAACAGLSEWVTGSVAVAAIVYALWAMLLFLFGPQFLKKSYPGDSGIAIAALYVIVACALAVLLPLAVSLWGHAVLFTIIACVIVAAILAVS